jgi:hypothetical protein
MTSNRTKTVLLLLLFANIITPMMRLPDFRGAFHDRSEQNAFAPVLAVENYISLGTLAFQAALFVWLKKNNNLFGAELIPRRVNISPYFPPKSKRLISVGAFLGLICTTMFSFINRAPQVCIHSDVNIGINTLLLTSSITHISNLIYDDTLLKVLKKRNNSPELIFKQELDVSALPDVQCLMCLDARECGYVNLCNNQEHIFCKECVITWFNEVRQRDNFVNKYKCELCRKDVPRNDEKFEIILPPEPKVTFELWLKQMGSLAIFYCVGLYVFVNLMRCQFS